MLVSKSRLDDLTAKTYQTFIDEGYSVMSNTEKLIYGFMELDSDYMKYSPVVDYYIYSYRVRTIKGESVNIKQDIKKILKSRGLDTIDVYRLFMKVQKWCSKIFMEEPIADKPIDIGLEKTIDLISIINLTAFLSYCIDILGDVKIPVLCDNSKYKYNRTTKIFSYNQSNQFSESRMKTCIRLSGMGDSFVRKLNDTLELLHEQELERQIQVISSNLKNHESESFKLLLKEETEFLLCNKVHTVLGFELLEKLLPDIILDYVDKVDLNIDVLVTKLRQVSGDKSTWSLDSQLLEAFKFRKFIVPYDGVKLKAVETGHITPVNKYFGIDAGLDIDVFEREYEGNYYIIALDLTKGLQFTIINLSTGELFNNNLDLYDVLNRLTHMYGIFDKLRTFTTTGEPILYKEMNLYNIDGDDISRVTKGTSVFYKNYTIEIPYYWRYRGKHKPKEKESLADNNDKSKSLMNYAYMLKPISAFKKKLPKGYKPSEHAKALAKSYCIQLEEGETFVSPFERKQRVKVNKDI